MKAFGPFVVGQIYLILNLVDFTVSVLQREDSAELTLKSFVNKLNRPKWSYNDVPNNVKANVQESPKMVVELDNTNGGKDVVTSNELKEVIKILDMLDGLGTRIPTSQPSFSNNENLPRTTPATEVQQKTNSFNKIKLISEKITHSLEHLSKLVGDYSGIIAAQNETLHGVLKNINNEVTKLHQTKLAKQKLQKKIPLSVKVTSPKTDDSSNVCEKGQFYKAAMDELALVTNRLKNSIGTVIQYINKRNIGKTLRSSINNYYNDDGIKTKSKDQAVVDIWDDVVKFYDEYQNKINGLVYDLELKTITRSAIGASNSDIELCKTSYEAFIKLLYSDVSKLTQKIDEIRTSIYNEDDVTKTPLQVIVDNVANNKVDHDPLVHIDLDDGSDFMVSLKKLMDKVHKKERAGRSSYDSANVYDQILKNTLKYKEPADPLLNQQRNQHSSPGNTVGANYVSLRSQCVQFMTQFFNHHLNDANVDDILGSIDNNNNPHPQVVCPHSSDYKQFIVKYFLFKMFIDDIPNCKLFFDNPKEMIRSIDTSCYHKSSLPLTNEVTKKPCKKNKHNKKYFFNDKLPVPKIPEIPDEHDSLEESQEHSLPEIGFDLPLDFENVPPSNIKDNSLEHGKRGKILLPVINFDKPSKPNDKIGHFIKYKIPIELLGGGKCIGSQTKPQDIREELKLYFNLLNLIYSSMNRSPTEKESLLNLRALQKLNRICLSKAKGDIELNYLITSPEPNKYFTVKLRIPFNDFRESALAELRDSTNLIQDIEDIYKIILTNCNVVSLSPELEHISDVITMIRVNGDLVSVFLSGVDTYTSTAKLDCKAVKDDASNEDNDVLSRKLRSLDRKKQNNTKNKPLIRPANVPLRFNRIW